MNKALPVQKPLQTVGGSTGAPKSLQTLPKTQGGASKVVTEYVEVEKTYKRDN